MPAYTVRAGSLATPVDCGSGGATVTNAGPSTVYYRDEFPCDATTNDGSIASGSSATLAAGTKWFFVSSATATLGVAPTAATTGSDGKVVYGAGAPSSGTGNDGDSYVDTTNARLYGPKAAGAWPGTYVSFGGVSTRHSVLTLGAGGSGGSTTALTDGLMRYALRLPATTTRWRLRFRNYDSGVGGLSPAAVSGVLTFQPVYIGAPVHDAAGALAYDFTAAPSQALPAFSTASDGSEYVSGWVTDPTLQFTAQKLQLLSLGFTVAASQKVVVNNNAVGMLYSGTGNAVQVGTQTITEALSVTAWGDVKIEYEWLGAQPVGIAVGDSLTEGKGIIPAHSWSQQVAALSQIPMIANGISSARMTMLQDVTHYMHTRITAVGITPDFLIFAGGINDCADSVSVATFKTRYKTMVTNLCALYGTDKFYVCALAPASYTGTPEATRTGANAWLRSCPLGALGCFDFDVALRSSADATVLATDYDSGDNVHWNEAGHTRAAAVVGRLGLAVGS